LWMVGCFSCVVSRNAEGFVPVWDTTPQVFLRCIPKRRSFSSGVSHTARESYAVHPTTRKVFPRRIPSRRKTFSLFHTICNTQRPRFSSIEGYNTGDFPPLLEEKQKRVPPFGDITGKNLLRCGIQRRIFFTGVG
jgi:hypothetical protein